jgi:hypothetical protein
MEKWKNGKNRKMEKWKNRKKEKGKGRGKREKNKKKEKKEKETRCLHLAFLTPLLERNLDFSLSLGIPNFK